MIKFVIFDVLCLFQKTLGVSGVNSAAVSATRQSDRSNSSTAVPPTRPTPQLSHSGHVTSSDNVIGCCTPTAGSKRSHQPHFVASPEPSPEGGYVGQHSQGIGGHYAESYLAKRRRKLWHNSALNFTNHWVVCISLVLWYCYSDWFSDICSE